MPFVKCASPSCSALALLLSRRFLFPSPLSLSGPCLAEVSHQARPFAGVLKGIWKRSLPKLPEGGLLPFELLFLLPGRILRLKSWRAGEKGGGACRTPSTFLPNLLFNYADDDALMAPAVRLGATGQATDNYSASSCYVTTLRTTGPSRGCHGVTGSPCITQTN